MVCFIPPSWSLLFNFQWGTWGFCHTDKTVMLSTNKRGCDVVKGESRNSPPHSKTSPLKSNRAYTPAMTDAWHWQMKEEADYFVLMYECLIISWSQALSGTGEDLRRKVIVDARSKEKLMLKTNVKSHCSWQSHGSRGISWTFVGSSQVPGAAVSFRNSQINPGSYPVELTG